MTLRDRIVNRIEREGPLTFAAFMDMALYDEDDGFYARPPVGATGDFVTSPHVAGAFGDLLAGQVASAWRALGEPKPFAVLEAGAGDGTLARRLLDASAPDVRETLEYCAIEIGRGGRDAIAARVPEAAVFTRIEDAGRADHGVVLANELLDNLPFHLLRGREGKVREVFVDAVAGALAEVEGDPTDDALEALGDRAIADGEERPVSPATRRFVEAACAAIGRGWVLLYDYGFDAGESPSAVRAYERHRMHAGVLERPGESDVTAGADFELVARTAHALGHRVAGPVAQRDVLKRLGFDEWYAGLRQRRLDAEARRDSRAILRLLAEQSRAPLLVDSAHLGGLRAIAIGIGVGDAVPAGF